MEEHVLGQRGRSLEEEFFRKEEAKLLERMRAQKRQQLSREELGKATGISDGAALEKLASLGLAPQTLAALALVPLVEVAWADGNVDSEERKQVMQAAAKAGLDGPSQELLSSWLQHAPDRALVQAWRSYVATLARELSKEQRATLRDELLGRARKVASASGGVLGMGKISKAEELKLKELESAFA